MYTTVNGIYENGVLILNETPPTTKKTKVIVTFLEEIEPEIIKQRLPGSLKRFGESEGKEYRLPDDFNEPFEDLKDYM